MTPRPSSSRSEHPVCEPRWATARTPKRFTIGPAIAAAADRFGLPLMPWQRLVADIGGEIDPDTGFLAYREVIVTVPRQSGKTTLILGWCVQRALGWDTPQKIAYSAQTGNDARKKLVDDWVPILGPRSKKLGIRGIRRANGAEAIEFANGSRIGLLASSEDSGHGKTLDLGVKDELFADFDDRRDQALVPAMATRRAAQILTTSTMGTDESFPLNRAVERGRQAVADGTTSGIAYFEWSADPDEDPNDPDTWRRCMPALGQTITEAVVVHARATLADGEFRRAFLNQQTKAEDRVIPGPNWAAVCGDDVHPSGELSFSLDVNPERNGGAIVAASPGAGELVEYRPGVGWIVARAKEINDRHGPGRWRVEAAGPAGSLIPDLERAGLVVQAMAPRDVLGACGQFYDAVMDGKVRVRRHPKLDEAVAGATRRSVGDAWAWTRKNASTDVCPLVALTLALWADGTTRESDFILI